MKKWQKELAAQEGDREFMSLIHEDLSYEQRERRKNKPHSQRDKHRGVSTRREVVISHDEE